MRKRLWGLGKVLEMVTTAKKKKTSSRKQKGPAECFWVTICRKNNLVYLTNTDIFCFFNLLEGHCSRQKTSNRLWSLVSAMIWKGQIATHYSYLCIKLVHIRSKLLQLQLRDTSLLAFLKAQLSWFIHSMFLCNQVCDVLTAEKTQLRWEDTKM